MHDEAITVLLRQIDLLYYMRTSGDRAEMRRVLRALIVSVRVLSRIEDDDCAMDHDGRHWSPYGCAPKRRARQQRAAERRAAIDAVPDHEILRVALGEPALWASGVALLYRDEYVQEAERRGLVASRPRLRARLPD